LQAILQAGWGVSDILEPTINVNNSRLDSQIVENQGHKILVLSGVIDIYTALQLKQTYIAVLDGTEQHLIVDIHNVYYMDSTGLGILISVAKRLSPKGGTLHLVGCNSKIKYMLLVTNVSWFVPLHQSVDEAIEAISEMNGATSQ